MNSMVITRVIILCVIFFYSLCPSSFAETTKILEGSITHSDQMTPLGSEMQIGKPYIDSDVPIGRWYEIPIWLEGKWDIVSNIRLSRNDLKRRIQNHDVFRQDLQEFVVFGYQRDSLGNPWSLSKSPKPLVSSKGQTKEAKSIEVFRTETSAERFTAKENSSSICYSADTKRITNVVRSEAIKEFRPIEDGLVSCLTDSQTYDEDGLPIERVKAVQIWKRIEDFKRVDIVGESDLRESFLRFLSNNGYMKLLPSNK